MAQINKPSDYFNTLLYSGNNTAQRQLTGVGFQPDLVWIKGRSGTYGAYNHFWFDSVRGVGKQIHSDLTNAESTNLNNLYSFDSDGFSLGQSGVDAVTNGSSTEFVSWNWLADNTSGSSNTDGTITSTVSANTTSGFSIVTYSGSNSNSSVGHGLGVAPKMIIIKNRTSGSTAWLVGNSNIGWTKRLYLHATDAAATYNNFQDTAPTSSVFTLTGNLVDSCQSGSDYVAYCFAEKKGFSKFGSYSGNSSNDGTFVYTGFKPAMVIVKCTNGVENWVMWDNKRSPSNVVNDRLFPNLSNAELTSPDICDLVSNGFKFRYGPEGSWNTSGKDYIYMAFAEQPLVGTNNIPATAR